MNCRILGFEWAATFLSLSNGIKTKREQRYARRQSANMRLSIGGQYPGGPMSGMEKRTLRFAVAIGSLVPICAGAAGVLLGPRMLGSASAGAVDLDSHFRYLSGLLLAIGAGYASTAPRIETHGNRIRLLTCIVVSGGVGRLVPLLSIGLPSHVMMAALVMELLVAPALAVWQHRVAGIERGGHAAFTGD
jgi:hypothetical protein